MSALSNKLFIVVLAAVIPTMVDVVGSAVLPSLNALLLVFALLLALFPFPQFC